MASDKQTAPTTTSADIGRSHSPVPGGGLKHRGPQRAFTFNEPLSKRRNSFFSDTLSDTHRSFRSSTDDLLLPRVRAVTSSPDNENAEETTHWHSLPLGLALLPAIAGVFFKDGSAVVTDVTLLGLAAIFLNWALRLPWDWYHSAQAVNVEDSETPTSFQPIVEDDENDESDHDAPASEATAAPKKSPYHPMQNEEARLARRELRIHEVLALLACFLSPVLGAWLLHAIRTQLSRPSEGLVSNYNLTIFLLMAELRPLSHLMKMIQRRTLFLQRQVSSVNSQLKSDVDPQTISDLADRLEELEAHIADQAAAQPPSDTISPESSNALLAKVVAQANVDVRKSIHPELDALNRAMRRYEKRMTISAIQVEARLQDVETRLKDVVALAAAAQRNVDGQPRNFIVILMNWISALIVIPAQLAIEVIKLPGRSIQLGLSWLQRALRTGRATRDPKGTRSSQKQVVPRPRPVLKKSKGTG